MIAFVGTCLVVMMSIVSDVFVEVVGIDRNLNNVHFLAVEVDNKQAHAIAFGTHEDEALLAATAACFANHPLPTLAELLCHHLIQFVAVNGGVEVFKLRHVQVADAFMRGLARDETDEAEEWNLCGVNTVSALNGPDNAVEATLPAAGQDCDGNQEGYEADGNQQ